MCYVLLVIQLLSMNGFFPLCYGFFPVCYIVFIRSVVWVISGVTCKLAVYGRIFSCLLWTFSCHSHLGICASVHYIRAVDMLCAVSYTAAKYEWIFPSLLRIFPVCQFVYPFSSLSDPWWYLQTPCVSADFFLSVKDFFLSFTPIGICVSVQYVQSSWYAMCC